MIREQEHGTRLAGILSTFIRWPVFGIAHDMVTQPHWAVTVFDDVFRLGYTGGVVESGDALGYTHVAFAETGATSEFLLASVRPDPDPQPFSISPLPSAIVTFAATPNGLGNARISFPLQDAPVFLGDLHSQWFYVDSTAAPLPLRSHDGFLHQIR